MSQTGQAKSGPWGTDEVRTLREHAHEGAVIVAIMLGRTEKSVREAAKRYRISLRRKGERRGLIMGQRGRWVDAAGTGVDPSRLAVMRSEVLDGVLDIAALEIRVREQMHGPRRPMCPSCCQREQERPSTGLCEVCHLRELARAHRDEVERREARRELWQARQEKSRRRRRT